MRETATDGSGSEGSSASENPHVDKKQPGALVRLFRIVLIFYIAVFALRFFAPFWWLADLFSHFPLQGFLSGIVLIVAGLCVRKKNLVLATCLMTCWYAYELLPYVPSVTDPPASPGAKSLLVWNVYVGNRDKATLIEAVRAAEADYVLLLETDERWDAALASLDGEYPHRSAITEGAFGISFLSREPVESVKIEDIGEKLINTVIAELPGGVTLYGVHCFPPRGAEYSRIRNQQIGELINEVETNSGPVIVAGDLNVSPWSPHFSKLTASGRLRDLRKGRGLINTWPAHNLIVRTPIDHVLPSEQIEVHSFERLPDACGSDHFGLLFRYSVRE
ncbi:MAG TPA: endonuclease/exonuclease/phosphatase family protein [Planctomycetaceae bacterium]|nr:endonuclease/exonuclease/phosphatase family protein [Planctomycetaceae bacterium]